MYTWCLLNFSFLCFVFVFFWDYRQKQYDIWRSWAGIVSTSLAFDTSKALLILLKTKLRKSIIKTEQDLFRQFSIWHQLGIYNIAKKWSWWNYNNLEFICILDDILIFRGIYSVSFFWDYHQKRCDIWRNWAGIVSTSLTFDTSSEFLI